MFYNKTKATMQLLWGPDGWLYIAQRDRILRVKDSDNDGVGDTEETIAGLDTLADYPHNGLSGMTWHTDGGLIFSLGENFGKDWTLRGSDGKSLLGRGEGGVFHCTKAGGISAGSPKGFGIHLDCGCAAMGFCLRPRMTRVAGLLVDCRRSCRRVCSIR